MKLRVLVTSVLLSMSAFAFGNSNKDLFNALGALAKTDCGAGSCWVEVNGLICRKSNDPSVSTDASCTMTDYFDGSEISAIHSQKATELFGALLKSGLNPDGAAGTSFIGAERVSCRESNVTGEFYCQATVDLPVL